MGLGSIVGTGLFVSLGIAAGVAGDGLLLALPLAAGLALLNGLSSAQLAAAHPVSGGTYEYGYRFLSPALGFTAGWTFLLAKSASAATAALGFGGYLLLGAGIEEGRGARIGLAAGAVVLFTVLVAGGIRRSNRMNLAVVGITLTLLAAFLIAGLPSAMAGLERLGPALRGLFPEGEARAGGLSPLLHASALLFVAYTGYGRIATLGEEVKDPSRTIPRAIWITLGVVAVLYIAVAATALGSVGADEFGRLTRDTAAPLRGVAASLGLPAIPLLVALAAITAMLGVLLNLLLGLSRVALAMGRRGDLPRAVGRVHPERNSPRAAVFAVGAVVLALVLLGDVRTTWSFSAFTVLVYYGITNLSALRLPEHSRLYPRAVPVVGLLGCTLLAFQVEPLIWISGTALLVAGLGLRAVAGTFLGRSR
jgi:basic amino acid/polyamine antiporter, APA family